MKSQNLHVLIIGGGIAGPALALLLKKAGISSVVYEAHQSLEDVGGGFTIAPNGMNVLEEIGLADAVVDSGARVSEFCFRDQSGKVLARFLAGQVQKYRWPSVATSRTALHRILMDEVTREGIQVEYYKRLNELTKVEEGTVQVLFEDGTTARGNLVVGADGVHSRVRQVIFPSAPRASYLGMLGIGGFVTPSVTVAADAADRNSLNFTVGGSGQFGYCNIGQNVERWMWWCHLPQDSELTSAELAAVSNEELRKKLLERYGAWHEPIGTFLSNTPGIVKTNICGVQHLPAWHHDRVVLVGDSAHAMSPSAGQGASIALEDALHLVKLLRQSSGEIETVFGNYERARRPRADRISAEAHKNETRQRSELGPLACRLRNKMLSMVLPLFGPTSLDWMYSYRVDWNEPIQG